MGKLIDSRHQDGIWQHSDAWVIYVDGEDISIATLCKEPLFSRSCLVYCCCYIMYIGFHENIDEVVELFEKKQYFSLFKEVNHDNILYLKKIIAVMMADAESFMPSIGLVI